jgi:hypothetical protein
MLSIGLWQWYINITITIPDIIKVKVTLQLTVSQSLCRGIEPILGLVTRYYFLSEGYFLKFAVLSFWGALSNERSGLSFVFLCLVICHYLHQVFTLRVFNSSAIINIKWVHQYATIYISCSSSTTCFGSMQPSSGGFFSIQSIQYKIVQQSIYNKHKASISPVWVQQIMLCYCSSNILQESRNLNGRIDDRSQV